MSDEWLESAHGFYYVREVYDSGPDGDNWCYIDTKTLTILSYRAKEGGVPRKEGLQLAGPFPTLDAAKAAYIVMFGRNHAI